MRIRILSLFLVLSPAWVWGAFVDDFNDNTTGPQWTVLTDDSSLQVVEQNQRLEVLSAPSNHPNHDALYLSNGSSPMLLSTADDFEISIDYNFNQVRNTPSGGASLGLVFGVGRDLDGTDSAAIGFFYRRISILGSPVTLTGVAIGHRTDDVSFLDASGLDPNPGTFRILYNASSDILSLQRVGGTSYSLHNTVRGVWNASELLISFGGRGDGFQTQSGDAYFDNFTIHSGTIVPEPTAMSLLWMGPVIMLSRRFRPLTHCPHA